MWLQVALQAVLRADGKVVTTDFSVHHVTEGKSVMFLVMLVRHRGVCVCVCVCGGLGCPAVGGEEKRREE